jgi:hypothetical protein
MIEIKQKNNFTCFVVQVKFYSKHLRRENENTTYKLVVAHNKTLV